MKMKYLIITVFVFTVFIYPSCAFSYKEGVGILNPDGTLYDNGGSFYSVYNSNYTTLKPSCQIVPNIDQKIISSGDNFSISFLLPCKGKIESSQLNIYFPEGFLSDNKKSYFSQFLAGGENKTAAVWLNEKPTIDNVSTDGAIISIDPVFFMEIFPDKRITYGEVYSPRLRPPILFDADSNEKIKPGDYAITIIFQYSDGIEWYSSYEKVDIHIRSFYETTWGQIIIAICSGIILLALPILLNIWLKYFEKQTANKRR